MFRRRHEEFAEVDDGTFSGYQLSVQGVPGAYPDFWVHRASGAVNPEDKEIWVVLRDSYAHGGFATLGSGTSGIDSFLIQPLGVGRDYAPEAPTDFTAEVIDLYNDLFGRSDVAGHLRTYVYDPTADSLGGSADDDDGLFTSGLFTVLQAVNGVPTVTAWACRPEATGDPERVRDMWVLGDAYVPPGRDGAKSLAPLTTQWWVTAGSITDEASMKQAIQDEFGVDAGGFEFHQGAVTRQ